MPVKFYPHKPIELIEKYIIKDDGSPLYGEIDIYRKLFVELTKSKQNWHVWHDLKLPKHSDLFNDYHKDSCQIDFLILCHKGILVLEVKGGSVSIKDNAFFYDRAFAEKMSQDPFRQAEGYKHTLKDKILNNLSKCLICHSVAFPHVNYPISERIFDDEILWTKARSEAYGNSIEAFIEHVFDYNKALHKKHFRTYPTLEEKEFEGIVRTLSPIVADKSKYDSLNTLEWLNVSNLEILEGLYKNKRIMIEGPPGSGKTTIAKAFIDNQMDKKGIYLCWNNFLMHYTKCFLRDRKPSINVEVNTLFKFLTELDSDIDKEQLINSTEAQFYETVKSCLLKLDIEGKLPNYDYMIIDEGQDMFDRGIDLIINKMCGYNKNGLMNGSSMILYDIDQSYSLGGRNVNDICDLLSEYYSHFKLNEIKRSAQYPDIKFIASKIFSSPEILIDKNNHRLFPKVMVSHYANLEHVKRYLVNKVLTLLRDVKSSLRGGECILLSEAKFLQDNYNGEPGLKYWLAMKDVEELDEFNVADKGNKLRYTSILKYKGLEKENVFLIVSSPSLSSNYELFVGVTRAICNLEILIVDH